MASDVVLGIGADTSELKSSVGSLAQDLIGSISSINPAVAAAVGVIGGLGAAALSVGLEFDAAFDAIEIATGATGGALEGLKQDFKDVFGTVPSDAGDVATAIGEINTRLQITGPALQGLSTEFLNASRLLGENLKPQIVAVTQALNEWHVDDQSAALNRFFVAAQLTGTSVTTLAGNLAQYGPNLQALGLSFDQATAAIALLELTTPQASRVLRELASSGDAGKTALQDFLPQIDAMVEKLGAAPDAINAAAASTDDFGEKWTTLVNSLTLAVEPVGTLLVGALGGLVEALNFLVTASNAAWNESTKVWAALGSLIGITDAAKTSTENLNTATGNLAKETKEGLTPELTKAGDAAGKKPGGLAERLAELKLAQDEAKRKAEDHKRALGDMKREAKEAKEESQKFATALIEMATEEYNADQKALALAGQVIALKTAFDDVEQPIIDVGTAMNGSAGSATALNTILGLQVTEVQNQKIPLDNLTAAYDALGVEAKNLKDEKLSKLKTALGDIEQAYRDGKIPLDDYKAAQQAYAEALIKEGGAKPATDLFSSAIGTVRTGLTDLTDDLLTFNFGNMGETLTGLKDQLLDTFKTDILTGPDGFITKGINVVMGALDGLINKITGGVGGALSNVFGGATQTATGGLSNVGNVGPLGGGPPGGGAGAAAGGLASTVTAIASVGSLISGVIGNFQNARQETTLNAIEENTRRGTQYLGDRGDGGIIAVLFGIKESLDFGNLVKGVEDFRNKFWDTGIPALQAVEAHGAYLQPTLDHFGSEYFSQWGGKFDAIERNTRGIDRIVALLENGGGLGLNVDTLKTAIERNTGGVTTTLSDYVRAR